MKYRQEELAQKLKSELKPIYCLYGAEPLLIQENAYRIRKHAQRQGFETRRLFTLENEQHFEFDELLAEVCNLSLFAEKKIVEIILQTAKLQVFGKHIEQLLQHLPDDIIIIIRANILTAAQQKSKWFKAIDQHGVVIQHWPLKDQQLRRWIMQRAQHKKLQLTPEAGEKIATLTEGNLLATKQAIEKCALSFETEHPITAADIDSILHFGGQYDVYDYLVALLLGQSERVLKSLSQLKSQGEELPLFIWGLNKTLSELHSLAFAPEAQSQLFQKLKIWPSRQNAYHAALRRLPMAKILSSMQSLLDIDKAFKSGEAHLCWQNFMTLSIQLCE